MRAIELQAFAVDRLVMAERPQPEPKPGEVLVGVRACSLNYRDWLMVQGAYNPKQKLPLVPLSDGAGEVIAVGPGVSGFKPGDRVVPHFFPNWSSGEPSAERFSVSMGGPYDGWLCEQRTYPAHALARIPDHLDFAEAATLPCAALTAWSAIVTLGRVQPGDLVLVQGTGGVSLFALQFAKLAGAEVIVTSSSDEKLEKAKALGADHGINYRNTPEWGRATRTITGGRGVDHIVEVGGAGTLNQSIRAIRPGGTISMIGVLSGPTSNDLLLPLVVMQQVRLQGVTVGSKDGFDAMLRAMSQAKMKPVLDRSFDFSESGVREAYQHMGKGAAFGKITVSV
ncbi:MAG TPA: NAD(P)-dependent alcohol dehydrogenase [Ferrovibrio sp.]|uniref:zinc-dependent alcohol dehydrogenase family protein n=1 Tax=Ferrovibrio sp. TaxID=1917215 RepID=UPI002B4B8BDA|nr:NAD(P)-dependent alcohol dehydrogenase [Ferrovibrio sp.]HLT78241.1 NAD(P)-dependent alcohol dehydrogenase [Ferrovibrio sp.]